MSENDAMIEGHRPRFLYRFYQFIAFAGAIPFVINTADILLHPLATPLDGTPASRLALGLIAAPLTLVMALLCVRRVPGNLISWMLIAFSYGTSALAMRLGQLPLTPTLVIFNLFISIFWSSYILIPLYYPNGRLFPPRLNRWGNPLLSAIVMLLFFGTLPFGQTIEAGSSGVTAPNPFFLVEFDYTVITFPLTLAILVTGAVTLVLRYRGSAGLERLQLRWLLVGVIGQFGLTLVLIQLAEALNLGSGLVSSFYAIIIPGTIAVALLRYRLYDIDIIIRKTLVYGALSGTLALVYFGTVVVLQGVIGRLTGVEDSPVAIVVSTLVIAALFTPVRGRVQYTIDRRFFRQKYDAEQVLARFGRTVRDEVDLEVLTAELTAVVQETMRPEGVSVWLKMKDSDV